ncbi:unnamed protein product [Microthlaspi erraticum]|uniref:Uncharacterized protein n=1 Tax=Microthlaspi erraticum TaxID=1685480 RepID=A0A6D2LE30_9BRAS|nr:unnamed protein product [Microthlaspi erraticum]
MFLVPPTNDKNLAFWLPETIVTDLCRLSEPSFSRNPLPLSPSPHRRAVLSLIFVVSLVLEKSSSSLIEQARHSHALLAGEIRRNEVTPQAACVRR